MLVTEMPVVPAQRPLVRDFELRSNGAIWSLWSPSGNCGVDIPLAPHLNINAASLRLMEMCLIARIERGKGK